MGYVTCAIFRFIFEGDYKVKGNDPFGWDDYKGDIKSLIGCITEIWEKK